MYPEWAYGLGDAVTSFLPGGPPAPNWWGVTGYGTSYLIDNEYEQ